MEEDYTQHLKRKITNQSQENNIRTIIDQEVKKLEWKIIMLFEKQIFLHQGFDDAKLSNSKFSGEYSLVTEKRAEAKGILSKQAGSPYNFDWTGDFIEGLYIKKQGSFFDIDSKGINDTGKAELFGEYSNMFGLNSENTEEVMSEVFINVLTRIALNIYE